MFTILSATTIIGGGLGFYTAVRWKVEADIARDAEEQINFLIAGIEESADEEISDDITEESESQPTDEPSSTPVSSDINFAQLKSVNSNTIGWIKVNNTRIDYPIVHADDNEYYLKHSFDHSLSSSGAIFLDYRNKTNFNNKHSIIYGHGRLEGTMFGTLQNALKSNWQTNLSNHTITIITESGDIHYKIFSAYRLPNTNDYLRTIFRNNTDFLEFVTMLKNRSVYNFGTLVSEDDRILTLSTCIGKNERMVVHAMRVD